MNVFVKERDTQLKGKYISQVPPRKDGYYRCAYCMRKVHVSAMEVDHIVPHSKHGSDNVSNLCPSCRSCNRSKSAKITFWYIIKGKTWKMRAALMEVRSWVARLGIVGFLIWLAMKIFIDGRVPF